MIAIKIKGSPETIWLSFLLFHHENGELNLPMDTEADPRGKSMLSLLNARASLRPLLGLAPSKCTVLNGAKKQRVGWREKNWFHGLLPDPVSLKRISQRPARHLERACPWQLTCAWRRKMEIEPIASLQTQLRVSTSNSDQGKRGWGVKDRGKKGGQEKAIQRSSKVKREKKWVKPLQICPVI